MDSQNGAPFLDDLDPLAGPSTSGSIFSQPKFVPQKKPAIPFSSSQLNPQSPTRLQATGDNPLLGPDTGDLLFFSPGVQHTQNPLVQQLERRAETSRNQILSDLDRDPFSLPSRSSEERAPTGRIGNEEHPPHRSHYRDSSHHSRHSHENDSINKGYRSPPQRFASLMDASPPGSPSFDRPPPPPTLTRADSLPYHSSVSQSSNNEQPSSPFHLSTDFFSSVPGPSSADSFDDFVGSGDGSLDLELPTTNTGSHPRVDDESLPHKHSWTSSEAPKPQPQRPIPSPMSSFAAVKDKLGSLRVKRNTISAPSSPYPQTPPPSTTPHSTIRMPPPGAPGFVIDDGAKAWNKSGWNFEAKDSVGSSIVLLGVNPGVEKTLDEDLAEAIRPNLSARSRIASNWELIYSIDQHGVSLSTLYSRVQAASIAGDGGRLSGFVLAVQDAQGSIFGACVNEPFHSSKEYYGNGECFVWKASKFPPGDFRIGKSVKAFKWTGRNEYFVFSDHSCLSVGGGDGKFGLWIDAALDKGFSARCPAFENDILCDASRPTANGEKEGSFDVMELEVWGIAS